MALLHPDLPTVVVLLRSLARLEGFLQPGKDKESLETGTIETNH